MQASYLAGSKWKTSSHHPAIYTHYFNMVVLLRISALLRLLHSAAIPKSLHMGIHFSRLQNYYPFNLKVIRDFLNTHLFAVLNVQVYAWC